MKTNLLVSRKWEVLTRIMKDGIFSVDDRMLVATTSVVLFRMSIYDGSCHQTSFLSLRGVQLGAVIGLGGMLNVFISPNGSTKMGKMKMQVGGLFLMFLA